MLAFFRSRMKSITWFIVWFIVITFGVSLLGSSALLFLSGAPDKDKPSAAAASQVDGTEVQVEAEDPLLGSTEKLAEIQLGGLIELVTEGEVEKRLRQTELGQNGKLPPESRKFFVPLILDRLIEERLIQMESSLRELDVSSQIEEQLEKIYAQFGGKEQYYARTGAQEADLRSLMEKQFRMQAMLDQVRKGKPVSEEEARAYYDAHKADYTLEGAPVPRPFKEVREEISDKLRSQVDEQDVADYYEAHKARWMLPPKAHLLHMAVDPRSEKRSVGSTPSEAEIEAYYQEHRDDFLGRVEVGFSHIFVNPQHPDLQEASKPSREEVEAYYEENSDEFEGEPKALLSQILIGGVDGAEKARAALERVKAGELFAAVAAQVSDDQATKDKKGDMGWLSPSELPRELSQVVFDSQAGKITDPIRTNQGYHILWVREMQEAEPKPLEEVRAKIVEELHREKSFALAKEKAQEIYALTQAEGADFAELARTHSHAAGSAQDGGSLGLVVLGENEGNSRIDEVGTQGWLDFSIQKALGDAEVGTILEPTRSFKGFHVIRIDDRPERKLRPLDEVRAVIIDQVLGKKREEAVEKLVASVREAVAEKDAEAGAAAFLEQVAEHSDSVDVAENKGDWGLKVIDATVDPELPKALQGEVVSWQGLSRRIVDAVAQLEAGELSEPVNLSGKQHLFYVKARPEREYRPLDEVREEIMGVLKPVVAENEMREYFEQNKAKYEQRTQGGAKVYHVLLRNEARASELISQIQSGAKDFDQVARSDENLDQSTKGQGGLIAGDVRIPSIAEAVKETEAGALYPEPVKSFVGWHIIKVGAKDPVKQVAFEDVQEEIRQKLLQDKQRDVEQSFVKELKNRARIEKFLETPANPFGSMLGGMGG